MAVATVTGLYSAMIMGGGAVGAWLAPTLVDVGLDWRMSLACMALPTVLALVGAVILLPNTPFTQPESKLVGRLLRRPRTWTLMAAFGLVNGGYASSL